MRDVFFIDPSDFSVLPNTDLTDFDIVNNTLLRYTGDDAFVIIPDGVTDICDDAFSENTKIKWVFLPEGILSIGDRAFFCCLHLKVILLPRSLEFIGEEAFFGCVSIKTLVLPPNVYELSNRALGYCVSLREIHAPAGISVEEDSLVECTALRRLVTYIVEDEDDEDF